MRTIKTLSSSLLIALTLAACSNDADVAQTNTDAAAGLMRSDVPADTTPDIADADYAAFISSANEFGLDLAQGVAATGALDKTKNGVFSPLSALTALAMTYGGAEGDVAAAMKLALHDGLAAGQYHVAQNRLMRELQGYNFAGVNSKGKDTSVQVAPANSLWAAIGLPLKTPFLDLLSQNYDGGVYRTDFAHEPEVCRQAINGWVEDKTKTRIKELLRAGDITERTNLVLVNALYLYANWQQEFEHESTNDAPFTTLSGQDVSVSMMHQVAQLPHVATDSFDAVEVPYVDGNLHLTLVLPKAGQFESVRASVSGDWLAGVRAGLKVTPATLGLPKFKVETAQIDLMPSLGELGFFDGGASITGIAEAPVEISKVVQKAFISADERGTEAAAATATVFEVSAPLPPEVSIIFNRPFLFFIQAESGIVLFSGQVVDPTQ